jgi:TolA-binding protein
MPNIAKLLNEKSILRKKIIVNQHNLSAVTKLEQQLEKIEKQIEELRGY